MADGDRFHQHLNLRYQQPYRQLCEGFVQPEEQARALAERVKRDLTRCHSHIAPSFAAIVRRLETLSEGGKAHMQQINTREEALQLRGLVNRCPQKRERELLLNAAQSLLGDLANGEIPERIGETLGGKLTKKIYDAEFGDVVFTPTEGQYGLPQPKPSALEEVEFRLCPELDNLGVQFSKSLDEEKPRFRLQPRRKATKIDDLDADITTVFKH